MESTGETWLTVLQHQAQSKEADTDALNDATHCEKAGNPLFVCIPQGGFEMWCVQIFFFFVSIKSILFYSASKVVLQQ